MPLRLPARSFIFALLLCLSAFLCFAQSDRGTITGVVRDSTAAVVPGAVVTIINQATNVTFTATSNEAGEFTVPSLQAGTYTVKVTKEGFRTSELKGIGLDAAQTVRADASLEVGTS